MTAPAFATLWFVPPAIRQAAELAVNVAMDSPSSCTHVGVDWMVCARHPTAGSFCPDCGGYQHIEHLLLEESCTVCGADGADQLGPVPHGDYEVLARWCRECARTGRS